MDLNFNKIMALGTIILVCSSFVIVSCKGASSRKAATEALEMIEKRSGKFGEAAEREAGSMERSVEENYNNSMLKNKRRVDRIREALDGDDEEYTPQQTLITCPVCKGNKPFKYVKLPLYALHKRVAGGKILVFYVIVLFQGNVEPQRIFSVIYDIIIA